MEHIKIKGSDQCYEIQSITKSGEHVLQIVFADVIPEDWGKHEGKNILCFWFKKC